MNLIRQHTDYAFRILVHLARRWPGAGVSARRLSREEDVAYQFTCKILQKLHEAGLVDSDLGPKGGYRLSRPPEKINMAEVVVATQGPVRLNNCMLGLGRCPRQPTCPVSRKLKDLQQQIDGFLTGSSLGALAGYRSNGRYRPS